MMCKIYCNLLLIGTIVILTGTELASAQEATPGLEGPIVTSTDKDSIDVELSWSPTPLEPDQETKMHIRFLQKDKGILQQHVDYKIFIEKDGSEVYRIPITHTNPGEVTIPYTFTNTGDFLIGVDVEGILFQPIPKETATFSILVVPEFPVSAIIVMSVVIAFVVLLARTQPFMKPIYKN